MYSFTSHINTLRKTSLQCKILNNLLFQLRETKLTNKHLRINQISRFERRRTTFPTISIMSTVDSRQTTKLQSTKVSGDFSVGIVLFERFAKETERNLISN